MTEQSIIEIFHEKNFRATPQRIAVYKYLCENRTHPDADEIYKSIVKMYPSFSKTTVYNALRTLENEGLIIRINIDSERVRYDAFTKLHGHFICEKCKKIFDFDVDAVKCSLANDFYVKEQNVYYKGLCPECK